MILVDAGPLVALVDRRDRLHHTAIRHLDALASDRFCTCDAVLAEACFHLPRRAQRQRLRALLERLPIAAVPQGNEPMFWPDVFGWLAQYAEHEPDWADGCLAVLCDRRQDLRVWTYDAEFRTTWRTPAGALIPMAIRR